eukprot:gene4949-8545_t
MSSQGSRTKQSTPLPAKKLLVLFTIQVCDLLAGVGIFPYLSQLTVDLLGFDEKRDAKLVGYYSGFIGSSYYLTQLFTAPLWGYLSDKYGRRPILLIGSIGTSISCLLFGFSRWFWLALLTRSLFGVLNGNIGVTKTYMKEICDETNIARAFALSGMTFALAGVVGPLIGGFTSRPANKIPFLFDNWFFNRFPYILPNLIISMLAMLSFILGIFFLEETKGKNKSKEKNQKEEVQEELNSIPVENGENIKEIVENEQNIIHQEMDQRDKRIDLNQMVSLQDVTNNTNDNMEIIEDSKSSEEVDDDYSKIIISEQTKSESIEEKPKRSILNSHILKSRGPLITVLLYAILGFSDIMFQEVFPIWAWTPISLNGLSLVPYQIGIIQGVIGLIGVFNQIFFTPWLINNFGSKSTLRTFSLSSILPLLMLIEIGRLAKIETYLMWISIIPLYLFQRITIFICFTASTLLVTNSVPSEELGLLNGIGQSSIALGRATGPALGSALFAFSISGVTSFPFDFHFVFYLCSILNFSMFLITFLIKEIKF